MSDLITEQNLESELASLVSVGIEYASCDNSLDYTAGKAEERILADIKNPESSEHFKLGRIAARRAITKLQADYASYDLDRLSNGQIHWPAHICGSVAHSGKIAVAVAAKKLVFKSLGIDIEANRTVNQKLLAKICGSSEHEILANQGLDINGICLLMFSAKEAIYKCLSPLTGSFLNFSSATLQKFESPALDRYQMLFAVNNVPEASSIEVSAFQNSAFTLTACHLRNDVRSEIID